MIIVNVQDDNGVDLAFQTADKFDVVITNMSRGNRPQAGLRTVQLIASKYFGVPVIIYSGTYGAQHRHEQPNPPVVLATNITRDVFNKVVEIARAKNSYLPMSVEERSDVSRALLEKEPRHTSEGVPP